MNLNKPKRPKPPLKTVCEHDREIDFIPTGGMKLTDLINVIGDKGLPLDSIVIENHNHSRTVVRSGCSYGHAVIVVLGGSIPNPNYEEQWADYQKQLAQYELDVAAVRENQKLWLEQQIAEIKINADKDIEKLKAKFEKSKEKLDQVNSK